MKLPDPIVLDKLKLGVQRALPCGIDAQVDGVYEHMVDSMVYTLKAYVYGKHENQRSHSRSIKVPVTWVDHFLTETRVGKFLSRWRKPRFATKTLTVECDHIVMLPDWARKLPPDLGHATIIAEYHPHWTDDDLEGY